VDIAGSVAVGGAPVVGAKVRLTNRMTRARVITTTDATGSYEFDPVVAGSYRIWIQPVNVAVTTTVSGALEIKELPVAGTKVRLRQVGTTNRTDTFTGADGSFSFGSVAPGTYRVLFLNVTVP
jgi:hypothetical protein